jgi:hypothetical protein
MTHPSYSGARRADESGRAGRAGSGDDTTQPGQYPPGTDHGIFGGPLPSGTGAPGTSGGAGANADPTVEAGQLTGDFAGLTTSEITDTGAPGSTGISPDLGGGGTQVSFTDPGSFLGGTYATTTVSDEIDGPGDWTQANDHGYATGGPQLPGIKGNEPQAGEGRFQPGGGSVMRGGRYHG